MDVIWTIINCDDPGFFILLIRRGPGKHDVLSLKLSSNQLTDLINGATQVKYGYKACAIGYDDPTNSNLK